MSKKKKGNVSYVVHLNAEQAAERQRAEMVAAKEAEAKKKIKTMWIFCVILILVGLTGMAESFLGGLFVLLAGVALCPMISVKTVYRTLAIIVCLLIGGFFMNPSDTKDNSGESVSTSTENAEGK